MPKQKGNVQTALKKLFVLNGVAWFCQEENVLPKVTHLAQSLIPCSEKKKKLKKIPVIGRQCSVNFIFFVFSIILSDAAVLSACMLKTGTVLGCSVGCSAGKAIEDT